MPAMQVITGVLEDGVRRELLYTDDLLVFKGVGPMAELCNLTDELIREALPRPTGRSATRDEAKGLRRQGRHTPEALPKA